MIQAPLAGADDAQWAMRARHLHKKRPAEAQAFLHQGKRMKDYMGVSSKRSRARLIAPALELSTAMLNSVFPEPHFFRGL